MMDDLNNLYKNIFDKSEAGIVVLNADGKIVLTNESLQHIFGYLKEELVGEPIQKLIPDAFRFEQVNSDLKKISINKSQNSKLKGVTKEGNMIDLKLIANSINSDKLLINVTIDDLNTEELLYELKVEKQKSFLEGIEKERLRLAGELHDGLIQTLSAVSLNLQSIKEEVECLEKDAKLSFMEALKLNTQAINETRAISYGLMPPAIERKGLVQALKDLAINPKLRIIIEADPVDDVVADFISVNIYRIFQELIENVIKHANASSLHILIKKVDHQLLIEAEDNGKGLGNDVNLNNVSGIGLRNIELRVKSMNGSVRFDSILGNGTITKILIPIN